MFAGVCTSFAFSFVQVFSTYPTSSLLYIFYPIVPYFLIFFPEISAALSHETLWTSLKSLFFSLEKTCYTSFGQPGTSHACSSNPNYIREEIETLKNDFHFKLRQSFFGALCAAYYAIFVPCCFAPPSIFIDVWWCAELGKEKFFTFNFD